MQSTLLRASYWLALFCRIVAGVALVGLLGVTIADVSTRYLARLTEGVVSLRISGSVELVSYLMLFSLLAAMAANVEKSQVIVEAFSHGLPDKLKTRLHGVYLLGFAALGLVIFIGLVDSATAAARHGEVTQDLRLPMGPIYYIAAVLSLLLGIRSFLHALLCALFGVEAEVSHGE
ncbi:MULTISPECIES: TRAP transporter small permease [unclassified Halomonas]|uniref:TRAP transporter small permease n=1 Tax=unclassified Halomonas TaxID=2609666 RepID=UPI0006DBCFAE|nr:MULTISPECIES: TRAP transporter small permease subunit [unclassified Halomonas]KPQ30892.1 MAG: TRAP-type transport system small permease component [Halomonas sp. HL-93]SBR52793.1 Tripartite ATP-independent transporter, DctQ component [Halomonas sp. HL-93]SNY97822.1 Tripartite ATP-independent transporter, DctQ component [Halomonas sp. hl-4]